MREKIAEIEFEHMLDARFPSHEEIPYKDIPDNFPQKSLAHRQAGRIIDLICGEIEKVKNPYTREGFPLMDPILRNKCYASFEVARQKFLTLFRSKENVVAAEGAKSG